MSRGEHRAVVIEADGGSRGNPGQAAYGAVLKDTVTGQVIAERAERIGVATNNVAEYRGLLAGLELYREHAPEAHLEVRMDSKLVVEQMSGRWKIKHPDMRPLALAARRLAPPGTSYTWIPRQQNGHADRLLNEALDARAGSLPGRAQPTAGAGTGVAGADVGTRTTLVLVRHQETAPTPEQGPSGRGGDPGLTPDGRAQARALADWLAPSVGDVSAVVTSPLRRARETAEILADRLGHRVDVEDALAAAAFATPDGPATPSVPPQSPDDPDAAPVPFDTAPGGGNSLAELDRRVRRARDRLIAAYPAQAVIAVADVTAIKLMVRMALGAPLQALARMELEPASVTVISWSADGVALLRLFNARPVGLPFLGR